eukprot:gnl/MRDRNA2_/MRDRNA2_252230_c0_seq1.p2 gnl/MRDRNA2_/MRDRNA2_252230_c0~~gnl/MRDRNA2_/MRDRNA2_252230_c0_seq1.p2  ORF type:complete len:109 (+),score=31.62 gnl/MRDRNA2_/MRDRNA2_252230_c0_seq1:458-784(+)
MQAMQAVLAAIVPPFFHGVKISDGPGDQMEKYPRLLAPAEVNSMGAAAAGFADFGFSAFDSIAIGRGAAAGSGFGLGGMAIRAVVGVVIDYALMKKEESGRPKTAPPV